MTPVVYGFGCCHHSIGNSLTNNSSIELWQSIVLTLFNSGKAPGESVVCLMFSNSIQLNQIYKVTLLPSHSRALSYVVFRLC